MTLDPAESPNRESNRQRAEWQTKVDEVVAAFDNSLANGASAKLETVYFEFGETHTDAPDWAMVVLLSDLLLSEVYHIYSGATSRSQLVAAHPILSVEVGEAFDTLDPSVRLPDRIGKYFLLSRLNSGGQGSLALARVLKSPRPCCAIKYAPLSSPHAALIQREGEIINDLAQPAHANIIRVMEFGEDDHYSFIALHALDGISLQDAKPPMLTAAYISWVGMKLASALEHVHQHSVLHLDIKAQNIFLERSGEGFVPLLLDFGFSLRREAGLWPKPVVPYLGGTPHLGAPEQRSGNDVDERTDIYQLGNTLKGLVAKGNVSASNSWRFAREVRTVHRLNACLDRATATQPDQRFQSAAEFETELALIHRQLSEHAWYKKRVVLTIAFLILGWLSYQLWPRTQPNYVTGQPMAPSWIERMAAEQDLDLTSVSVTDFEVAPELNDAAPEFYPLISVLPSSRLLDFGGAIEFRVADSAWRKVTTEANGNLNGLLQPRDLTREGPVRLRLNSRTGESEGFILGPFETPVVLAHVVQQNRQLQSRKASESFAATPWLVFDEHEIRWKKTEALSFAVSLGVEKLSIVPKGSQPPIELTLRPSIEAAYRNGKGITEYGRPPDYSYAEQTIDEFVRRELTYAVQRADELEIWVQFIDDKEIASATYAKPDALRLDTLAANKRKELASEIFAFEDDRWHLNSLLTSRWGLLIDRVRVGTEGTALEHEIPFDQYAPGVENQRGGWYGDAFTARIDILNANMSATVPNHKLASAQFAWQVEFCDGWISDVIVGQPNDLDLSNSAPIIGSESPPATENDYLAATHRLEFAAPVERVSLYPDGSRALIETRDHTVHCVDTQSGAELFEIAQEDSKLNTLIISPDSQRLLCQWETPSDGELWILYDAEDGKHVRSLGAASGFIAFTPDAHFIYDMGYFGDLERPRPSPTLLIDGHSGILLSNNSEVGKYLGAVHDGRYVTLALDSNTLELRKAVVGADPVIASKLLDFEFDWATVSPTGDWICLYSKRLEQFHLLETSSLEEKLGGFSSRATSGVDAPVFIHGDRLLLCKDLSSAKLQTVALKDFSVLTNWPPNLLESVSAMGRPDLYLKKQSRIVLAYNGTAKPELTYSSLEQWSKHGLCLSDEPFVLIDSGIYHTEGLPSGMFLHFEKHLGKALDMPLGVHVGNWSVSTSGNWVAASISDGTALIWQMD